MSNTFAEFCKHDGCGRYISKIKAGGIAVCPDSHETKIPDGTEFITELSLDPPTADPASYNWNINLPVEETIRCYHKDCKSLVRYKGTFEKNNINHYCDDHGLLDLNTLIGSNKDNISKDIKDHENAVKRMNMVAKEDTTKEDLNISETVPLDNKGLSATYIPFTYGSDTDTLYTNKDKTTHPWLYLTAKVYHDLGENLILKNMDRTDAIENVDGDISPIPHFKNDRQVKEILELYDNQCSKST
jgi:hypothetical protein